MMKDRTTTHITSHILIKDKSSGRILVAKSLNKAGIKHQKIGVKLEKKNE
jgi:hypothetical protein